MEWHHVQRFYGAMMCRNLKGNPSIANMYSTRNSFHHIAMVCDSLPQDLFRDLHRILHFVDDFGDCIDENGVELNKLPPALLDDEDWSDVYSYEQIVAADSTSHHRRKFSYLEEAYNKRWEECVNPGNWLCMDESRLRGWYKSCMTIGPEPKPIRTGATAHTMCIAKGELDTYKLRSRVYGGKGDTELKVTHENTSSTLVWINLFNWLLEPFKGKDHSVVCDSAYMSDTLGMIGRAEWGTNILGTCQTNCTGKYHRCFIECVRRRQRTASGCTVDRSDSVYTNKRHA